MSSSPSEAAAFVAFCRQNRLRFHRQHPSQDATALRKLLKTAFAELSPDQRRAWEKAATKEASGGDGQKNKTKKKKASETTPSLRSLAYPPLVKKDDDSVYGRRLESAQQQQQQHQKQGHGGGAAVRRSKGRKSPQPQQQAQPTRCVTVSAPTPSPATDSFGALASSDFAQHRCSGCKRLQGDVQALGGQVAQLQAALKQALARIGALESRSMTLPAQEQRAGGREQCAVAERKTKELAGQSRAALAAEDDEEASR